MFQQHLNQENIINWTELYSLFGQVIWGQVKIILGCFNV